MTGPAAAGLVLLGLGIGDLVRTPSQPALSIGLPTVQPAPAAPVATIPSPSRSQTPAPVPLWLTVPRLAVTAPVVAKVQIQTAGPEKGLLTAPPNYHELGWFRETGPGLLVLDGHVGFDSDPGPLAFIGNLKAGDRLIVGTRDGRRQYLVQTVARVLKGQLPARYFTPAYDGGLMLITCDYTSPFVGGHFADNVYVVASPEP